MNNTDLPTNWTDQQRAAYAALKAKMAAPQTVTFGKAPKDGWKDSDRVPAR